MKSATTLITTCENDISKRMETQIEVESLGHRRDKKGTWSDLQNHTIKSKREL